MRNHPEELLHFIWQFQYFDTTALQTSRGEKLQIIKPGMMNNNAGPDFFNSRIKIANQLWAGNVEIHWKSSEWELHNHQQDAAYNNVILHVVFDHDRDVYKKNGDLIPTLELKSRINYIMLHRFNAMMKARTWIPCEKQLKEIAIQEEGTGIFFQKLLIERLEEKTQSIRELLQQNSWNWEEAFYRFMARGFGFKVNSEPFYQLSAITPLQVLVRHKNNLLQLEALLLGQAGFLDKSYQDEYMQRLKREYLFLKNKYKLTSLPAHIWKFGRMRPANFPTIRIVQFAALIHHSSSLFSRMIEIKREEEASQWLYPEVSEYWKYRYMPDGELSAKGNRMGKSSARLLILNVVAPFMFLYGKERGLESMSEIAIELLNNIPAEANRTIKNFEKLGINIKTAADSQALIVLKNRYCDQKRCLYCIFGKRILTPASNE
ncbi:MAG: DUF2851 family protein [Flavobacteriales bacterium]|nr:DUF2851 family protein [Flavobacteriales bacterium]